MKLIISNKYEKIEDFALKHQITKDYRKMISKINDSSNLLDIVKNNKAYKINKKYYSNNDVDSDIYIYRLLIPR